MCNTQDCWVLEVCQSSGVHLNTASWKLDLFPSSYERVEGATLLDVLEIVNPKSRTICVNITTIYCDMLSYG